MKRADAAELEHYLRLLQQTEAAAEKEMDPKKWLKITKQINNISVYIDIIRERKTK